MTRKTTPACHLHDKFTARHPGACPLGPKNTIQDHLRALLEREAGHPLDLTRRWPLDRPTRQAIRTLAHQLGLRPWTVRRHAKGSRWLAGPCVRDKVQRWTQWASCLESLIERDVHEARINALAARQRAATTLNGRAATEAREAALRHHLED
jgi:hypothetical protein